MTSYVPCPQCGSADIKKVNFTWWGGLLGPRLFNHVKCNSCGFKYNGKTGKPNTTAIIIYSLAAMFIFGTISFIAVASISLLPYLLDARKSTDPAEVTTGAAASPTVLTSSDGQCQITIPAGWKEARNLNPRAALQAAKSLDDLYIFVIARSRKDFKMALDRFTDLTRSDYAGVVTSPQFTRPDSTTVNGQAAMQYEVRGIVNGTKVAYLNTTIMTEKNLYQVVAYTLDSKFDKNKHALDEVTKTLRERAIESPARARAR
jgi:rubredoxin/bifunctional DNA-binding transcriptional regulator/antitoxin component of YhaV-PrlF toxin-antitoxin module